MNVKVNGLRNLTPGIIMAIFLFSLLKQFSPRSVDYTNNKKAKMHGNETAGNIYCNCAVYK